MLLFFLSGLPSNPETYTRDDWQRVLRAMDRRNQLAQQLRRHIVDPVDRHGAPLVLPDDPPPAPPALSVPPSPGVPPHTGAGGEEEESLEPLDEVRRASDR